MWWHRANVLHSIVAQTPIIGSINRMVGIFICPSIISIWGQNGTRTRIGVDDFEEVPFHVRERLNADYAEKGLQWLQEQVKQKDPVYFSKADIS